MQPANIAVTLRRRSPWEATDLGLAMLQRWWRPVFAAHAMVLVPISLVLVALGWAYDAVWVAIVAIWWLEPVYDSGPACALACRLRRSSRAGLGAARLARVEPGLP